MERRLVQTIWRTRCCLCRRTAQYLFAHAAIWKCEVESSVARDHSISYPGLLAEHKDKHLADAFLGTAQPGRGGGDGNTVG
jgi:hypothetical protein